MSNTSIGYEENAGFGFILTLIVLSFLANVIFNVYYVLKNIINKVGKKVSFFEHILFTLSIAETLISLFWLFSLIFYKDAIYMKNNNLEIEYGCKILGFFQTFAYFFDWILSGCAIYHLRNMILNPINFILKPFKKIIFYIIISILVSLAVAIISLCIDSIGRSPMNSCFLSEDTDKNNEIYKNIIITFFIFTPIYILIFFVIQILAVKLNPLYKNDTQNKGIFDFYYKYSLVNLIITSLMPILFIIDWVHENPLEENQKWLFFPITLIICLNPLLLGILHLREIGFFKCHSKDNQMKSYNIEQLGTNLINTKDKNKELNIEKFEKTAIKKFVMNIYIAVCYCLEKANFRKETECEINQENCNEINEFNITKSDIMSEPYILKLDKDILIKSREDFEISCVEYAPEIFSYLRKLDGINEEEILNSMLPMNNQIGLKDSEGRGGSFFINSDDNEFSIKTITQHEAELLKGYLLYELAEYLSENRDSIIGRIYGMYKISNKTGLFKESDLYFILMKNVIGSFNENLICKYDLKGSSLNRKVNLGEYGENVLKDNNFREVEQVLLLNKKNADKLKNITTEDANFFAKVEIMDYSLLVAKLSLNKNEMEDLFGKNHRRQTEIEYFQMAGIKRQTLNLDSNITSGNNNQIFQENNKKNEKNDEETSKIIRYKKNKLKPLKKYFFPSLKGDVLYIISIIDFFQQYNLNKSLETKFKMIIKGASENEISSVPPQKYKDRFIEFIESITDIENYVKGLADPESKNDFE